MDETFRLLFVGDLHYQVQDRGALLCSRTVELWRTLLASLRHDPPRAIIQVGDLIDGYHLPVDTCKADFRLITSELRQAPCPVHALIGNHEVIYLPDRPFLSGTLAVEDFSRVVELGPLRLVMFDLTVDDESHGSFSPARAAWLEAALTARPAKPCVVVQHQLIHPTDALCTHRHFVHESETYRRFLASRPEVKLIVTGHRHIPTLHHLGSTPQVTLSAFCSWPFTLCELHVHPARRSIELRERPLEEIIGERLNASLPKWMDQSRRLLVEKNPAVWGQRERMSPELKRVAATWT